MTYRLTRTAWLAALIVFAAALTLYVRTLAPSIVWAHNGTDGSDLTTAAATLGVPHPPGYPTYVTIGYLFSKIPINDVAYRLNLMSAVCMALAAGLTTLTIIRLITPSSVKRGRAGVGVIAGLAFAASPMAWGQATIAEVHGLNAFCVTLILFLIAPLVFRDEKVSARRFAITTLAYGVSLGNLLTIAALSPLMIVAWWKVSAVGGQRPAPSRLQSALVPIMTFFIGVSVYGLVAVRAATNPPIDWGNAITLNNFLYQITARLYQSYAFALPISDYPHRLIAVGQLFVAQFGWLGVLLGALGVYQALNSQNRNWRWLAGPIALYSVFTFAYNTIDADIYFIPIWLFAAWAIARGSLELVRFVERRCADRKAVLACWSAVVTVSVFGPGLIVIGNFSAMDLSRDNRAAEFIQRLTPQVPANAILLTGTDADTFTLWYYRAIERLRPDIAVVDMRLSAYADWYNQMVVNQGHAPNLVPFDPDTTWPRRLAAANPDRPLCVLNPYESGSKVDCNLF